MPNNQFGSIFRITGLASALLPDTGYPLLERNRHQATKG